MKRFGLEPLGLVLARDSALRVPSTVETSPVAYRDWEAAVGSRIAARARPFRLDRGVLFVRTATATWAQELALLSDAILAQLRGRGVAVEALRFRVGPVDAPARPPSRDEVRTSPPEIPLPPAIEGVLARVPDPELRDAIAHAAAKNLGWQETLAPKAKKKRARVALSPPAEPGTMGGDPPYPPAQPATSTPSDARAPRSAERGTAPPGRSLRSRHGGPRGSS